jgi:hypothetical protein
MAIDWSTKTANEWKVQFERYITGGGTLGSIIETAGIEQHFKQCLPIGDFGDKVLEATPNGWRITATHSGVGERFEIVVDKRTKEWAFNWLGE